VVAALRGVLGSTCNEDATVISLNRTEPDWNVEVNAQQLPRLLVLVYVIESNHALIKLEEVDAVWLLPLLVNTEVVHAVVGLSLNLILRLWLPQKVVNRSADVISLAGTTQLYV
jgi:hypothetical protein